MVLGNDYISFGHVRMVYHIFKVDDHNLKGEDIERMDKKMGFRTMHCFKACSEVFERVEKYTKWKFREDTSYKYLSKDCC